MRVGDILRINNDTHSVVVLEIKDNSYVIVEGNMHYKGSEGMVYWDREINKSNIDYVITRYPN